MSPEIFISQYSTALASQDWNQVAALIHENACVTFSNGAVHKGKTAVEGAYTRNFTIIKNENYSISDIHWAKQDSHIAVYLFRFDWKGVIDGNLVEGSGRGTCTLVFEAGKWLLIAEHLGKN